MDTLTPDELAQLRWALENDSQFSFERIGLVFTVPLTSKVTRDLLRMLMAALTAEAERLTKKMARLPVLIDTETGDFDIVQAHIRECPRLQSEKLRVVGTCVSEATMKEAERRARLVVALEKIRKMTPCTIAYRLADDALAAKAEGETG